MKQMVEVIAKNVRRFMELHNMSKEQETRDYWLHYMSGVLCIAIDLGYSVYVHHVDDLRYKDIDYITISYQGNIVEEIRKGDK